MSDGADSEQLEKLGTAINEMSKAAATQALTYLLLWLYLLFTVTGVTDYDLLVENPIKLPIFNLEIGLLKFFIGAPALFCLVQLYMARKVTLIADAMRRFLFLARTGGQSLETLRHRVDGFVITRLVARFETVTLPDGRIGPAMPPLPRALTVLAAGVSLVLAPMLLYLAFQYYFLAYQEEWITWWHRGFVFFGLVLSAASAREAGLTWRDTLTAAVDAVGALFGRVIRDRETPRLDRLAGWTARASRPVVIGAGLFVLTFPGEFMSDGVEVEGRVVLGWPAEIIGIHNTLSPKPQPGAPVVAFKDGEDAKAGAPPLDLRHRDFSGRNLRGINLVRADMTAIKLVGAVMDGANLFQAKLDGSDLFMAQLNGADLQWAQINGSSLFGAQLNGADLRETKLNGSYLFIANLIGANLLATKLNGASLLSAQLNGSSLFEAELNGADLLGAQLNGSYLIRTQLNGADLRAATLDNAYFTTRDVSGSFPGVSPDGRSLDTRISDWLSVIPSGSLRDQAARRLARLKKIDWTDRSAERILIEAASKATIEKRTDHVAELICSHADGRYMLQTMIDRTVHPDDLSPSMLAARFANPATCPAANHLTKYQRRRLADNVEKEKRWREEQAARDEPPPPVKSAPAFPSHAIAFQ